VAALAFAIPIIRVTIADDTPHLHRVRYRAEANLALEGMVTLCLAGPKRNESFAAPSTTAATASIMKWPASISHAMFQTRCKPQPNSPATVTPRNG
jgi:hypothetical protein